MPFEVAIRQAVEVTNLCFGSKMRPSGNLGMSRDVYSSRWAFARLPYSLSIINLCLQETFEKYYVSVRFFGLKEFIVYWGQTVDCNVIQ